MPFSFAEDFKSFLASSGDFAKRVSRVVLPTPRKRRREGPVEEASPARRQRLDQPVPVSPASQFAMQPQGPAEDLKTEVPPVAGAREVAFLAVLSI